jgi:endonuclease/exonuclease/phosphatase family metal-dependent hydrolase
MSLNMAHGRRDEANQLLVSHDTFKENLLQIAELINRENIHLVALQEADGPSRWSGGFDHVHELAEYADYPWYRRASHAQSWLFDYGTAFLSRLPFEEVLSYTFQPSPPTMDKGILLVQIAWMRKESDPEPLLLDLVSVHLDFSRKSVREQQIAELTRVLEERKHPIIILGDFNSDWFARDSIVQALAENEGLQVYRPDATDLGTYKNGSKRLDWILISEELEFQQYAVLPDMVSDHKAVMAEIIVR